MDGFKKTGKAVDIVPDFGRVRHRSPRGRRLIVPAKPPRALRDRGVNGLAVVSGDVLEQRDLPGLNARPVPLDHAAEENLFKGTLLSFPKVAVDLNGRPLVRILVALAMELPPLPERASSSARPGS